jgi:putative restriction endonuclease
MLRAYVGITDRQWFEFLRSKRELDELNFWQPSGRVQFHALSGGEPFLFKLHSPHNYIVGGGFFTHSSLLPCSLAWEAFGEKNGSASLSEMRRQINNYRRAPADLRNDPVIGCIILRSPFFFSESDWIPVPSDWAANIVQGRRYDLTSSPGRELWDAVSLLLSESKMNSLETAVAQPEDHMYGDPVLIAPRLGQGAFRVMVTDFYERRCAVTREKSLPVLEAAHIKPIAGSGTHRIGNGLLIRSDIHRLFDRGYVTVTPDYRFHVSHRLRDDFNNGEIYYRMNGGEIWVPREASKRPDKELLEWHADTIFLG